MTALIYIAVAIYIAFIVGLLYIFKRLREGKNIGLTIVVPIAISFIIGFVLLVISFSQV